MARINPDAMMLDGGEVAPTRKTITTTTPTAAELDAAEKAKIKSAQTVTPGASTAAADKAKADAKAKAAAAAAAITAANKAIEDAKTAKAAQAALDALKLAEAAKLAAKVETNTIKDAVDSGEDDSYYTKIVGNTGLTAAQIDTRKTAKELAQETGQVFDEQTGFIYPAGTSADAIQEATDAAATLKDALSVTPDSKALQAALDAAKQVEDLAATTGRPGMTSTGVVPTAIATGPTGPAITETRPTGPTVTATTTEPTITSTTATEPTGSTVTATTTTAPTTTEATTYKASDGTVFTDQAAYVSYQRMLSDKDAATAATSATNLAERQSAYDLLYAEFAKYGLGSLVEPLKGLIQTGASPSEFTLKLRESEPYKKRFSANAQRVAKGLTAIDESTYIGLEDQYQNIMRNAGLPETYWKRGDLGTQEGFTNFIANDVSAVELEDRISTAQKRILYANPEVSIALKTFYPDISNGDLLAYALDPTKGLEQIKRRVTAAEIGSSAVQMGLATNVTDAEYLARYGVTKGQAQEGYRKAAEVLPTSTKLGEIYAPQGLGAYTQQTAEQEFFNVPGAAEAAAKRRKLAGLEQASFSGKAGAAQGALARERAGNF